MTSSSTASRGDADQAAAAALRDAGIGERAIRELLAAVPGLTATIVQAVGRRASIRRAESHTGALLVALREDGAALVERAEARAAAERTAAAQHEARRLATETEAARTEANWQTAEHTVTELPVGEREALRAQVVRAYPVRAARYGWATADLAHPPRTLLALMVEAQNGQPARVPR
jgi:hypothetical protein